MSNNDDDIFTFELSNDDNIDAEFELEENRNIDCIFEINATGTTWGIISGTLSNQEDLQAALDLKADKSELEADMAAIDEAINDVQTAVENNYSTLDTKIDNVNSELSGDISTLTNTVNSNNTTVNNRIDTTNQTVANLSTTVADNNTAINTRVDGIVNSFDGDISSLETALQNEVTTRAENDTLLQGNIKSLRNDLTSEISERTTANNTLQGNINTLTSDLSDEVIARTNADTTLQSNINTLSDTVESNYATLDNKIDSLTGDLNNDISALTQTVSNNYTQLNTNINTLSGTVATNDTAINSKVDGINTTLTNSISTLSDTVESNYTTLDNSIDKLDMDTAANFETLTDTVRQNYTDLSSAITNSASTINNRIDTEVNTLNTAITTENTQRQAADNNLQSQIDAITSASDVFDIVGTYTELQAYDIASVPTNDIIKVLVDSSHNNAATYYRCVDNDGVKSWSYIGSEGAYYTKSETDTKFVDKTTTINNKPLANNITLEASDIGALPDDTVIGSGVITLQKNGTDIDSFNVNTTTNKSINITVPTKTSDLRNDSNFATVSQIPTNNNQLTNGANYITATALTGYATEDFVTEQGYITGITSNDVTTALGYTPYNATNPNGYITANALDGYATEQWVTTQNYVNGATLTTTLGDYVTDTSLANTLTDYALTSSIPTKTSDLRNDSNFATVSQIPTNNNQLTNGANYITATALTGYATENWVTSKNYVDGTVFTNTLADYALTSNLASVATSGDYDDLINKPTIPTVNNGTLTIQKNGTTIGTFTANQSDNSTINIEADTVLTDNTTITKNSSGELQAIGVIDDNTGSALKTWTGTKTQYDAIDTKGKDTLYWLTDAKIICLGENAVGNFSSGKNVGEIVQSSLPLTDAGLHLLDGALIQGDGIYADFVNYIAGLYNQNYQASFFCTEAEWQTSISTYGSCGKFVYDSVNNTVRLPKISDILQGTTDINALGDLVQAGLPNITGVLTGISDVTVSGAIARGNRVAGNGGGNGIIYADTFNASLSNPIYGNSTTVQPQTIKAFVYIVVATSTKTDIQVDIDNITTDLNGKAGTDLTNVTDSGKILMSGMGMPSSTYINLTLGASGTVYTAPANGWFFVRKIANAAGEVIYFYNSSNHLTIDGKSKGAGDYVGIFLPALKGQMVICEYTVSGNVQYFQFIYAQGSSSEAN